MYVKQLLLQGGCFASVDWLVCQQECSESYEWIFINFSGSGRQDEKLSIRFSDESGSGICFNFPWHCKSALHLCSRINLYGKSRYYMACIVVRKAIMGNPSMW